MFDETKFKVGILFFIFMCTVQSGVWFMNNYAFLHLFSSLKLRHLLYDLIVIKKIMFV